MLSLRQKRLTEQRAMRNIERKQSFSLKEFLTKLMIFGGLSMLQVQTLMQMPSLEEQVELSLRFCKILAASSQSGSFGLDMLFSLLPNSVILYYLTNHLKPILNWRFHNTICLVQQLLKKKSTFYISLINASIITPYQHSKTSEYQTKIFISDSLVYILMMRFLVSLVKVGILEFLNFIILKFQVQKLLEQNQRIIIEYSLSKLLNYMENTQGKSSYLNLASTNCSIDIDQSDKQDKIQTKHKGKKRIGPYSFYLRHLIGSGYEGKVYKGIKDNNKNTWYAIKIIKLKGMNVANIYLLNNEIGIMQELNHQNVVKFIDVYYTENHCYLITQFCEGGNLEKYIKNKQNIQWGSIVYQISQGCQYLVNKNIVHRDLKPANIFLKNGVWKIGDFGFAKKISHSGALIIQSMRVGSPLFMPLQTLERNMYSIKSDSFALGVVIYYLIARGYPHSGKDVPSLIQKLKEKELDFSKLDFLKSQILDLIKGLCKNNFRDRSQINQVDFSVFLTHKSIEEMQSGLLFFRGKTTEQVVLCQFINYLMKNSVHFLEDDHILYSLMSTNLYHLTTLFKWEQSKCLNQLRTEYILPSSDIKVTDQLYKNILKALETTIVNFRQREESVYQVATEKLLEYYRISKCILQANTQNLNQILKSITLHQNFTHLKANKTLIDQLLPMIQAS